MICRLCAITYVFVVNGWPLLRELPNSVLGGRVRIDNAGAAQQRKQSGQTPESVATIYVWSGDINSKHILMLLLWGNYSPMLLSWKFWHCQNEDALVGKRFCKCSALLNRVKKSRSEPKPVRLYRVHLMREIHWIPWDELLTVHLHILLILVCFKRPCSVQR